MLSGSLVIVHDGSYNPKGDTTLCSAGFVIFCEDIGCKARGAVAEGSNMADNYGAEIPGELMVQLVLRAALLKRDSANIPVQIECDNASVVKHGNSASHSLLGKQPQADILRCLRQ